MTVVILNFYVYLFSLIDWWFSLKRQTWWCLLRYEVKKNRSGVVDLVKIVLNCFSIARLIDCSANPFSMSSDSVHGVLTSYCCWFGLYKRRPGTMFESISDDSFFIRTATCLVSLSRYGQVNSMISSMSVTGSFFFPPLNWLLVSVSLLWLSQFIALITCFCLSICNHLASKHAEIKDLFANWVWPRPIWDTVKALCNVLLYLMLMCLYLFSHLVLFSVSCGPV